MISTDNSPAVATDVTEDQVTAYLRAHPDFLLHRPELIVIPPSRWKAGKIVDLQYFMIDHLREELNSLRACADKLLHTSRSNMSTQERTHQAVLALIKVNSFTELCRVLNEDLPTLLTVDLVILGLESCLSITAAPIVYLDYGDINRLLGSHLLLLQDNRQGDPILFGKASCSVHSYALVRLYLGPGFPHGLLALGAHSVDTFHAGQGTELLVFLAQALELCIQRYLITSI